MRSRTTGYTEEEKLLYEILKKLDQIAKLVAANGTPTPTTTTTTTTEA